MAWRYLIGLLIGITALGYIFDQTNIIPGLRMTPFLLAWWPALVIIFSANYLIRRPDAPWGSLVLIGFGIFLLVEKHEVALDNIWLFSFAVLVLLFSIELLLPRRRHHRVKRGGLPAHFQPTVKDLAVFNGTHLRNESQQFQGGKVLAVMADYEIDLREALLSMQGAELELAALFGTIVVRIPQEMCYKIEGQPFLGGLDNRAHQIVFDEPGRPVLRLRCRAALSAITITN